MNTFGISEHYQNESREVACPFHTFVPAGTCQFKIDIPKLFLNCPLSGGPDGFREHKRHFFFSNLRLTPDFFNQDALLHNLDTEEDLAAKLFYELQIAYYLSENLYSGPLGLEVEIKAVDNVTCEAIFGVINSFYVANKPSGLKRSPFFLDWTDFEYVQKLADPESVVSMSNLSWEAYVKVQSLYYYGTDYTETLHANKLPASLKGVALANHFLFPTNITEERRLLKNLRVRIAVAPNTKVLFSSKKMLELLGFQTEEREGRRFAFVNLDSDNYKFFMADVSPIVGKNIDAGKISVKTASPFFFSSVIPIMLNIKEKIDNKKLFAKLKKLMDDQIDLSNVEFTLNYNQNTETFNFVFPAATSSINIKLVTEPDLCQRLGFGYTKEILNTTPVVPAKIGKTETGAMAKTLVFDTGHVVVTCFNTSSNLTSVGNNQFLASLFPDQGGSMSTGLWSGQFPSVVPPSFEGGQSDSISFLCQLRKFNDNGQLVPLDWKTGAFVSGVLCGKV